MHDILDNNFRIKNYLGITKYRGYSSVNTSTGLGERISFLITGK